MNRSTNILIKTVSAALAKYAIENKLSFFLADTQISLEEAFSEGGALTLFLFEGKRLYESIYNHEFIVTFIEYEQTSSFPVRFVLGKSFCDYVPIMNSAKNFEDVLIFTTHALIQLHQEQDGQQIQLDDLNRSFNQAMICASD